MKTEKPSAPQPTKTIDAKTIRVKTGVRAGDCYMHNPRGSNDRLN